jgi:hypothetical protein
MTDHDEGSLVCIQAFCYDWKMTKIDMIAGFVHDEEMRTLEHKASIA